MQRINGQMTTIATEKLSAFNADGRFRAVEWLNRPAEVKMRYKENDNALLEFTRQAPLTQKDIKNPFVWYSVDGALATYTVAASDAAWDATEIVVEDAYLASAGHTVVAVGTGEEMLITSVNLATSTWTVDRTYVSDNRQAIFAGEEFRVMIPMTGEDGRAKNTHTTEPGDPEFNVITLGLWKTGITDMQRNAAMEGEWGTWDFMMASAQYQAETAAQNSLLFQHRKTTGASINGVDEGQVYRGAGLLSQLENRVLELGDSGATALVENLSEFIDPMFASRQTAEQKEVFAGSNLFGNILKTGRQRNAVGDVELDDQLGAETFEFRTNGGKKVMVRKVKGFDGKLADYGLVLDANNIGSSEYAGLGPQWFLDTQDNAAVISKEATYLLSFESHIYDRSTCGLIKGSQQPLLG